MPLALVSACSFSLSIFLSLAALSLSFFSCLGCRHLFLLGSLSFAPPLPLPLGPSFSLSHSIHLNSPLRFFLNALVCSYSSFLDGHSTQSHPPLPSLPLTFLHSPHSHSVILSTYLILTHSHTLSFVLSPLFSRCARTCPPWLPRMFRAASSGCGRAPRPLATSTRLDSS